MIGKWLVDTCLQVVSLFHPARRVWVAYPFCIGYGRLKVTRGYPNVIRLTPHDARRHRGPRGTMDIETEFLAMGITRARRDRPSNKIRCCGCCCARTLGRPYQENARSNSLQGTKQVQDPSSVRVEPRMASIHTCVKKILTNIVFTMKLLHHFVFATRWFFVFGRYNILPVIRIHNAFHQVVADNIFLIELDHGNTFDVA